MPRKRAARAEPTQADITPSDVCVAYKQTFSTPESQIVLADLMHRFAFTRTTTLVPGKPDMSNLREGQRTVVIHIGRMLDADPADFEHTQEPEE